MNAVERMRATYDFRPVDHLYRREFYIWKEALDRWEGEGMPPAGNWSELFGFDAPANFGIGHLGWCEPAFVPAPVEQMVEKGAEYDIVRDSALRLVKVFPGRRHGFMPTYVKHAVTNDRDWEQDVLPLLRPDIPQRWAKLDERMVLVRQADAQGQRIQLTCVGGYMYLRSLVGPEEICYLFVDNPPLVHKMMQAWLDVADAVATRVQRELDVDEVFLAEDICYNHGLLISPTMVKEFIFPYYQQLLTNVRRRQRSKRVFFQVDTDGNCDESLELYCSIGMDAMSPFEVAAGNDVVAIARKYPNLVMSGGIDKRVLAEGKGAIDGYLNRVIPVMVRRGGYIPTCDHGVPDNVSYADYLHYRRRLMELDH